MGAKCETEQKNLAIATADFNALQLNQPDKPDLTALDGSIQKVGETYTAYRDCITGSHSSVKRINPPKKKRIKPSIELDDVTIVEDSPQTLPASQPKKNFDAITPSIGLDAVTIVD